MPEAFVNVIWNKCANEKRIDLKSSNEKEVDCRVII